MSDAEFVNILIPITLIEMMVAIGLGGVLPLWLPLQRTGAWSRKPR